MRKIQAKTLGRIVTRYAEGFAAEAIEMAREAEPEEGAGLLLLLPPATAWSVLQGIGTRASGEWLDLCDDETLRRLLREAPPGELDAILEEAAEVFARRAAELRD